MTIEIFEYLFVVLEFEQRKKGNEVLSRLSFSGVESL